MSTPFTTRRSRRAGVFVGFWIVCIASIIADSTAEPDGVLGTLALAPGSFYTGAHTTLTEFAQSATVPAAVPLVLYLVLAFIAVFLSLYILETYTYSEKYYHFVERVLGMFYLSGIGAIYLLLFIVFAAVLLAAGSVYVQLIGASVPVFVPDLHLYLVLDMSPQALVFATFLLVVSLVTAFVP